MPVVMNEDDGLTVARMAELTGVSGHTLRYYERIGLLRPVERSASNHRRYRPEDVDWIRFLLRLRETGMPISRMREYSDLRQQGDGTLRPRMSMLVEHHERLREQLARLQRHEIALETKIAAYEKVIDLHEGSTG